MLHVLLGHQEAAAGGPDPWLVAAGVLAGGLGLVWFARSAARSVAGAVLAGLGCTLVAVAVLGHRHGAVAPAPALAVSDLACPVAADGDRRAALLVPPPEGFVPTLNDAVPTTQTLADCRAHEVEVDRWGTATVAVGRLGPGELDQGLDLRPAGSTAVGTADVGARVLDGFEHGPPVVHWTVGDLVVMAELESGAAEGSDQPLAPVEALVGGIEVADAGGEPQVSVAPGSDLRLGAEVPPTTWAINGAARHIVRYAATGGDGPGLDGGALEGAPALSVETVHLAGEDDLLDRALEAARRGAAQGDPVAVGDAHGSIVTTDAGTTVVAASGAQDLVVVRGLSVSDDVIVDAAADVSLVRAAEADDAAPVADLAGPITRDDDGSYEQAPSTPVLVPVLLFAAPVVLLALGLGWWWRRRAR